MILIFGILQKPFFKKFSANFYNYLWIHFRCIRNSFRDPKFLIIPSINLYRSFHINLRCRKGATSIRTKNFRRSLSSTATSLITVSPIA